MCLTLKSQGYSYCGLWKNKGLITAPDCLPQQHLGLRDWRSFGGSDTSDIRQKKCRQDKDWQDFLTQHKVIYVRLLKVQYSLMCALLLFSGIRRGSNKLTQGKVYLQQHHGWEKCHELLEIHPKTFLWSSKIFNLCSRSQRFIMGEILDRSAQFWLQIGVFDALSWLASFSQAQGLEYFPPCSALRVSSF